MPLPMPMPTQSLYQPGRQSVWPIFPQTGIPALMQDPRNGAVYQNPAHSQQKWYWLFINATSPHLTIPASALGVTAAFTPGLEDGDLGDFEIVKFNSTYDANGRRAAVRIYDSFMDRFLMNGPVCADFVFGNTEYPGQLYESLFVPASTSLVMYWDSLDAAQVLTCLTAQGRRFMGCADREALWQAFRSRRTHPYWLTFDQGAQVAVPAGTTVQATMTVPAGFDFDAWSLMDDTVNQADTTAPVEYTIRMYEGTSGRSLFGTTTPDAVEISNVAAKTRSVTGVQQGRLRAVGNPNMMTFTHLFPQRTQIQVEITAPGGTDIFCRLAMHGQAIYAQRCTPDQTHMTQQSYGYQPVPGACGQPALPPGYFPGQFQPAPGAQPPPVLGPGYGAISPVPQYPLNGWRR